jgi:hypothetical protein
MDHDSYPNFFKSGFKFAELLKLKFDFPLQDAAGSQILPRQRQGVKGKIPGNISTLHNAAENQILPQQCGGESNLSVA